MSTPFAAQAGTSNTYNGVVTKNDRNTYVKCVTFKSESDARAYYTQTKNDYKSQGYVTDSEPNSNEISLSKPSGVNSRELVQMSVENLSGIGWSVIIESTNYVSLA